MKGLFVTATDTGVGKTLVTAACALYLRTLGVRPGVMKPAETGVTDPSTPGPDARLLAWAAAAQQPPDQLAPWRLRQPLAPAIAAEREDRELRFEALTDAVATLGQTAPVVLIEGCGGLLVPLCPGRLLIDLIAAVKLPVLLVSRPALGTINHTLLSLQALRARGIAVAGWVLTPLPASPGAAEASARAAIEAWDDAPCLGVFAEATGSDEARVRLLADQLRQDPALRPLKTLLDTLAVP